MSGVLRVVVPVPLESLADAQDRYLDDARALVREQVERALATAGRQVIGELRERWLSREAFMAEVPDATFVVDMPAIQALFVVEVDTEPVPS